MRVLRVYGTWILHMGHVRHVGFYIYMGHDSFIWNMTHKDTIVSSITCVCVCVCVCGCVCVCLSVCLFMGHDSFMCDVTESHPIAIWLIHVWREWVTSHMSESRPIWMSHVPHEWVMSHCDMTRSVPGITPCYGTRLIHESRPIWMSHVPQKEALWDMRHDLLICVTWLFHMSRHTCGNVTSHMRMSHVTHMNGSWHATDGEDRI